MLCGKNTSPWDFQGALRVNEGFQRRRFFLIIAQKHTAKFLITHTKSHVILSKRVDNLDLRPLLHIYMLIVISSNGSSYQF